MTKKGHRIGDGARIDIPSSECEIELSTGIPDRVKDKRGVRRGRLVAQEFVGFQVCRSRRKAVWQCLCDCGNTLCTVMTPSSDTFSCGCLIREINTTHGASLRRRGVRSVETKVYLVWLSQIKKCYRPNSSKYPTVGGRGIKMCDRWVNNFPAFLEDVGLPPTPQHVLVRLDYDKDYEPSNMCWMPRTEHQRRVIARVNQKRYKDKPKPSDDQLTLLAQKYPDASLREYCELFAKETGMQIGLSMMTYRMHKLGLSSKEQKPSDDQLILFARRYPDAIAREYCELIANETGIRISRSTVQFRLQKLGLARKEQRYAMFNL